MAFGEVPALGEIFKERELYDELVLGFRFGVFFFAGGVVPNPLDIRFQKVSGLTSEVTVQSKTEGGQNLYTHSLPDRISHGNLVLTRGMVVGSLLNIELEAALGFFQFAPSNVMVTVFSEKSVPLAAWLFLQAFPVKWSTSDLDAEHKAVIIDTMELAYTRMQRVRI